MGSIGGVPEGFSSSGLPKHNTDHSFSLSPAGYNLKEISNLLFGHHCSGENLTRFTFGLI